MRVHALMGAAASLLLAVPTAARIGPFPKDDLDLDLDLDHLMLLSKRANDQPQEGSFQQLIDHNNPELGTFSQRYWYNANDYAGPGSPIILNAPEEGPGDKSLATIGALAGMMATHNHGAAIVLEHRYWGKSSPVDELTTANLQYLTLDNAIRDLTYFAHNVELPFDKEGASKPTKAPWVLTGCSYGGALAAWTHHLAPGTFWAYHCSSATVQAISALSRFQDPVKAAMPKNCSTDMQKTIEHIDGILSDGTPDQKHALKKKLGLESLTHDSDFATALQAALEGWTYTKFKSRYPNPLYKFCDYLENIFPDGNNSTSGTGALPGPEGVGMSKALDGFARWMKEAHLPGVCAKYGYWQDKNSLACLETYNASSPIYTDLSVDNTVRRQWMWLACNEPFEWWFVSGPENTAGLISKHTKIEAQHATCRYFFPQQGNHTYGLARGRTVDQTNQKTGGWSRVNTTRLMWVNGEYDPWRAASVSADARPGGPLKSTPEAPVWVIPKAAHCNDIIISNSLVNPALKEIVVDILYTMKNWVEEFKPS